MVSDYGSNDPCRNYRGTDVPATIRDVHEHIAGVERGLFEEIERRIASEERIREQVEAKIKVAVDRLADVTETEMARMFRRLEADLMDKMETVSRELANVSNSIKKLNNQVELVTVETRENRTNIARFQKQIESMSPDGLPNFNNHILESGKKEFSKLKEIIDRDLDSTKKLDDIKEDIEKRLFPRVDTIEDWLKTSLTPEMLRLREKLELEKISREENERNMMDIVSQYTSVIQKHFDYLSVSTERVLQEKRRVVTQPMPPPAVSTRGDSTNREFVNFSRSSASTSRGIPPKTPPPNAKIMSAATPSDAPDIPDEYEYEEPKSSRHGMMSQRADTADERTINDELSFPPQSGRSMLSKMDV